MTKKKQSVATPKIAPSGKPLKMTDGMKMALERTAEVYGRRGFVSVSSKVPDVFIDRGEK